MHFYNWENKSQNIYIVVFQFKMWNISPTVFVPKHTFHENKYNFLWHLSIKVRKRAKIRDIFNQATHLTQDTGSRIWWLLGSRFWCLIVKLSVSHWYPGSGAVLECIDLVIFALFLNLCLFPFLKIGDMQACFHTLWILPWSSDA